MEGFLNCFRRAAFCTERLKFAIVRGIHNGVGNKLTKLRLGMPVSLTAFADSHCFPMTRSMDSSQLAAAAKLFSSSVVQEMARTGRSPLFSRLAAQSTLTGMMSEDDCVGRLFDVAFNLLKKKAYRYEYAYKSAITHKVLLGVHSLRTASMLTEFRIGACKADLAILNGTSTVYEIKSERDNLDRLSNQIINYRKVFAKVNIITGENHLEAIRELVPEEVGILLLNDRFQISMIRDALNCPEKIIPQTVFESIHRSEAVEILTRLGGTVPDVPNTRFHAAMLEKFEKLPPVQLHECMIAVLKVTRSLLPLSTLVDALPRSLQAAAFSTPLHRRDHQRLLSAIETPLSEALTWA